MRVLIPGIMLALAACFCGASSGAVAEDPPSYIDDRGPELPESYVVLFEVGSVALTELAKPVLDQAIRDFEVYKPTVVHVNGYYDRSLTETAALDLSRRMAEAVRDYLVANGVTPSAIELAWFGEAHPQVVTEDGVAEAANRSVDVIFDDRKNSWRQ